jgi:hypothetical protein
MASHSSKDGNDNDDDGNTIANNDDDITRLDYRNLAVIESRFQEMLQRVDARTQSELKESELVLAFHALLLGGNPRLQHFKMFHMEDVLFPNNRKKQQIIERPSTRELNDLLSPWLDLSMYAYEYHPPYFNSSSIHNNNTKTNHLHNQCTQKLKQTLSQHFGTNIEILRHHRAIHAGSVGYFVVRVNNQNHENNNDDDETKKKMILVGIKGSSSITDMITDSLGSSVCYRCAPYSPFATTKNNSSGSGSDIGSNKSSSNNSQNESDGDQHNTSGEKEEEEIQEIRAHEGILASSIKLLNEIHPLLEPYVTKQGYTVRLVGHSLGAGVASVLAVLLRTKYIQLHKDNQLHAYCFGTPPVLDMAAAQKSHDFVTAVVNRDDCFTRMSMGNAEILVRFLEKIDQEILQRKGLNNNWKIAKELSYGGKYADQMTDESYQELVGILREAQKAVEVAHPDHLYVPGKIIALYANMEELPGPGQDPEVFVRSAYIQPTHLFLRFFEISDRMLSDHKTGSYQESLSNCIESRKTVEVIGKQSKVFFVRHCLCASVV